MKKSKFISAVLAAAILGGMTACGAGNSGTKTVSIYWSIAHQKQSCVWGETV